MAEFDLGIDILAVCSKCGRPREVPERAPGLQRLGEEREMHVTAPDACAQCGERRVTVSLEMQI